MAWQLTKSLARFRRLVDERWPNRDHASDGTIGDTAHQASTSGHNADDTPGSKPEWDGDPDSIAEVRAFDMDADLREPGTTAQMLVDHLIRLPGLSTVFRYVIFNRFIYRASTGWAKETYTGSNPHTEHIHFSGAYSQAADDNETFDFRLDQVGDTMSKQDALDALTEFFAPKGTYEDGTYSTRIGRDAFNQCVPNPFSASGVKTEAWRLLQNMGSAVGKLSSVVAAMAAGAVTQEDIDALKAAVDQVDEATAARLVGATPEATAALLRPVLGDQAAEVGRILAASAQ